MNRQITEHEALKMRVTFPPKSTNAFESEFVGIRIGSLSCEAAYFPDCRESVKEELAIIKRALDAHETLVKALVEAEWLVGQLAPGMKHLALQDYASLNTAMLAIPAALRLATKKVPQKAAT